MITVRRKVVGKGTITKETIIKERHTPKTTVQKVERKIINSILLDCGHQIEETRFGKVPTSNTRCYLCEIKANNAKDENDLIKMGLEEKYGEII